MFIDKSRLNLNPHPVVNEVQIAEDAVCYIVDDVYQDPHYVREVALSLDYNHIRSFYPGYDAMISLDPSEFIALFSRLAGRKVSIRDKSEFGFLFSQMCDSSPVYNRHYPHPHVDLFSVKNRWKYASTLYLNLPEHCNGGTAFYRHRESELVKFPMKPNPVTQSFMEKYQKNSLWELYQYWTNVGAKHRELAVQSESTWGMITETNDQWEKLYCVEMKFNRLAFHDSMIFHCPEVQSGDFANTHTTKRLIQQFFLAADH
jgi:hypothetical protein